MNNNIDRLAKRLETQERIAKLKKILFETSIWKLNNKENNDQLKTNMETV